TRFAPGTYTFKAQGAKGATSITVTATNEDTRPCKLTGIYPATVTSFVHQPGKTTFLAEGEGLSKVQWKSDPKGSPASHTRPAFTAKWSQPGKKTIAATCGGQRATATVIVVDVSISINDGHDIVRVEFDSYSPSQEFPVPCKINLIAPDQPPADVKVTLKSPD